VVDGEGTTMTQSKAQPAKAVEAFRTISEVGDDLDVPKHVLRFWEGKFPQIKPMKRGGGRRYYRPEDVELLRGIRRLLYDEGYTITGVQKLIRDNGLEFVKTFAEAKPGSRRRRTLRPVGSVTAGAELLKLTGGRMEKRKPALAPEPPHIGLSVEQAELLREALAELRACRLLLEK
jgi:DNA-binding transcriptional MerR regulator